MKAPGQEGEMLTKEDSQMSHGLAILAMVMLHLFCRIDTSLYHVRFMIGEVPAIYFLGLFGDICVPIYCFSSGYANYLLHHQEMDAYGHRRINRLFKFLKHYWLVVILFSFVGWLVGSQEMPGSVTRLLGNLLLYRLTYNGSWWFVVTFTILMILCPALIRLVGRANGWIIVVVSGAVYFAAYLFRFNIVLDLKHTVLNWIWQQLILLGTSQFSFVIGMLFCKFDILSWIRKTLPVKLIKVAVWVVPGVLFLGHCLVQSLIVAPVTGILTLVCFHLWEKPAHVRRFFLYFGHHSTNIWLTHMFFYLAPFTNLVFKAEEPVLIFAFMLALCLGVSYAIEFVRTALEGCVELMRKVVKKVKSNHELQT